MTARIRTDAIQILDQWSPRATDASDSTGLELEIVGLFDQMRDRVLRYSLTFGLSAADAEEVVQDVFLALYQHLARSKSREGIRNWLFRVTHNLSLKRRAAVSRASGQTMTSDAGGASISIADPGPNPEDQYAFRQRRDRLRSVVDALPQMDRECLYLRAEGFRYREIAGVMGISLGSVANSLARSLSRLAAADERVR